MQQRLSPMNQRTIFRDKKRLLNRAAFFLAFRHSCNQGSTISSFSTQLAAHS
jgi:hypothetical protein